jgi:hypothetical protein
MTSANPVPNIKKSPRSRKMWTHDNGIKSVLREFYRRVKRWFQQEHIETPYTYPPPVPPDAVASEREKSNAGKSANI